MHWLPYGVDNIVEVMKKKEFAPDSWDAFKAFCEENKDEIQAGINRKGKWPLERGIKNAGRRTFLCPFHQCNTLIYRFLISSIYAIYRRSNSRQL
jgi:hypothetical protein